VLRRKISRPTNQSRSRRKIEQTATIRIRGWRSETEEEPDGEEEDEDDGALWESVEDMRELIIRLSEEIGELDEPNRMQLALIPRIERYFAGAHQIQKEIANDEDRAQRIQGENQHLAQVLEEIQEGRHRDHARMMRLLDRRRRQERGLMQLSNARDWTLCKLRWHGDARWVMARPGTRTRY
jgi:hypothetical protein